MIHQEFNLAEDLTIAQNIFLGPRAAQGLAARRCRHAPRDRAGARTGRSEPQVPTRRIAELIVAERQLVEIAKALARNARVLVMDEPTATLTPGETERLFAADRAASGEWRHHPLHLAQARRSRAHHPRGRGDARRQLHHQEATASLSTQQMASLMVGRELADVYPAKTPQSDCRNALARGRASERSGLGQRHQLRGRAGEILGFAGLVGAGRTELFEGLIGLRKAAGGRVTLAARPGSTAHRRWRCERGLTYLSEDRKQQGTSRSPWACART